MFTGTEQKYSETLQDYLHRTPPQGPVQHPPPHDEGRDEKDGAGHN